MTKNYLLSGLLLITLSLLCGCDDGESSWQKTTRQDLEFMREQILENHPGPINQEDPDFTKNLEASYDKALSSVAGVKKQADYWRTIQMFAASFNDGHLSVFAPEKNSSKSKQQDDQEKLIFDEIAPQVAWVRLPTFELDDDQKEQIAQMLKMFPHLRNYKAIVFDLHGNTGGNSAWGNQLLDALFTPTYVQQQRFELWQKILIDYRVSKDNIKHIRHIARSCAKDFGKDCELARGYAEFADIMQLAADRGDQLVRVPKGNYKPILKNIKDPVRALIVVIIDHQCASACLDFIDGIKGLQHPVILFGETTGADTFYMDVRELKLPSGRGTFVFPIKVFRGRARGNNEPYRPDIPYNGDLRDTPRVAEVVYRLIMGQSKT